MPTINKPKKNYNSKRQSKDVDRKERMKVYNTKLWRDLRESYLMQHPLCEVSLLEGRTVLAEHIHHWRTFTHHTGAERDALAFDSNNLVALSSEAHWRLHHGDLKGCESLDEVEHRLQQSLLKDTQKQ